MPNPYNNLKDDSDGFSIAFGDMVFGLLFFFFVFSLIMVFQRPEVKQFHNEQNKLLKQNHAQQEELKLLRENAEMSSTQLAQLQAWRQKAEKQEQQLTELQRQKEKLDYIVKELRKKVYTSDSEEQINELTVTVRKLRQKIRQLQYLEQELNDQKYKTKSARLKRAERQREISKLNEQVTQKEELLDSVKDLLNQKGQLDLLAEIERIEAEQQGDSEDNAAGGVADRDVQAEKPVERLVSLFVILYGQDEFSFTVYENEQEVASEKNVDTGFVTKVAGDIVASYKKKAKNLSKEQQRKFYPRMHLMCYPQAQYGYVEKVIKKFRKIIPVSLVKWTPQRE